ncbi:MAG: maltose ABC transporter permease MalF [Burkholderiales bacterium]|nr:maltose ABC transporter permease MalF [Burkholderiales bacterium]
MKKQGAWIQRAAVFAIGAIGYYGVLRVHAAGQSLLALVLLALTTLALWTYASRRTHALRYLYPAIAGALVFVIFPMLYTMGLGLTNYSSRNLLDRERVRQDLLGESVAASGSAREFTLRRVDGALRLRLEAPAGGGPALQTPPLTLDGTAPQTLTLEGAPAAAAAGEALTMREVVARLPALRALHLRGRDGGNGDTPLSLLSLREFAALQPLYLAGAEGALVDRVTGTAYHPDDASGFYTSADGERLQPGYRVFVGLSHYAAIFGSPRFRAPFIGVFAWTVAFAALSVLFAAGLGLLLAVLLNWEELRFKGAYRLVLFLPYAVPGFISILVFKGLFNQNLGEINLILHGLFGIRPAWFSDPALARTMLLIVNTWLGFPYMMVLCTGLIQSIPADLYEASAVAGAGPWANFRSITMPLIVGPLKPILISTFAFNFNNFVLVSLLTGGRPDQVDAVLPAGTTDILVSYTWRIAFQDSGQQFGLAAAISTVIFALVAAITLVQLRYTKIAGDEPGR